MARGQTCDICNRPTTKIVQKMYITPIGNGQRATHSDYTHHADVGICCADRLPTLFKFQERRSRKKSEDKSKA
jgi:hypothetical protein